MRPSRPPARPEPSPAADARTAPTAPSSPVTSAALPPASADAVGAWQRALAAWLQAHKTYPEAARRDGLQGRVIVRFTMDHEGAVREVLLVRSSGSPELDDAATTLLRGARLPPPPASAPDAVSVTLPIRYSLEP